MIYVLGKKIDCHQDFKLIMCTKNENCLLPAEVAPYVTILNFNVTYSGFTEQLLSSVITQEKPELEHRKKQLLLENEELQEKLHVLQNQLLECLVNSDENILNDKKLLTTLNETKTSFMAISGALSESKKIQNELRKEFEVFLDISSFGSKLYMACGEFAKYDILYSLSANSYKKLFLLCIKTTGLGDGNMGSPKKQLFQSVYNYMSRGMFKGDRLPFFFHLAYRTFPNEVPEKEINVFLGNGAYQKSVNMDNLPAWLPKMATQSLSYLKDSLPDVIDKCQFNQNNMWAKFMESSECEKDFPSFCKLTEFQKLLIIQSLRPDRLLTAIENCVLQISGLQTIDPPVLSLQHSLNESTAHEPILLITKSGMDPSAEIRDLAEQLKHEYEEISMGEGQEEKALLILNECKKNGKWLILKNLQLVSYWLPALFQNISNSNISHSFRLWLVSTSTQNFNVVLAQNCLKIAYEEPQGIANIMQRIYASLGEKYEKQMSRTSARIFFVFSCVHALLQERRNYIPQGWTNYYEFNHTDIQTCLTLTEDLWNVDTTRVQWEFIQGLVNEAVYSGRVENVYDRCILDVYLKMYFKDEVLSYKWKPPGLNINLPNATENKEYIYVIKKFPKKDQPIMFGLPENIYKAKEKQIFQKLISGLKGLYGRKSHEVTKKDSQFGNLLQYINLWKKNNEGLDFIKVVVSKELVEDSAIKRFIHEEYVFGIRLIQEIHKSFINLNKLTKGILESDDDSVIIANSLTQHQTPQQWLDIWNGPKDPALFLYELLEKATYISKWTKDQSTMIKQPIKLSLFFGPDTFLASLKQDYARATSTSLDNIVLRTSWTYSNNDAIVLSNLLIEGAIFEKQTITTCKADSDSINLVPNCHLHWINKETLNNEKFLKFPLYTNSTRKFKITSLQVECGTNEQDQWILNGVAFYLKH